MPVKDFKKFYHGYCIVSTRIIIHLYSNTGTCKLQIPSGLDNNVCQLVRYQLKISRTSNMFVTCLTGHAIKSLIMNKIMIYCS